MAIDPCKQEGDAILLVEGKNDCHVTLALRAKHGVPEAFDIYECGSDDKVLQKMNGLIMRSDAPNVIGIVLDADSPDLKSRWLSVTSKLVSYDYKVPASPVPEGVILPAGEEIPRLGIWLMPNNKVDGMLDDFCCEMIDPDTITTMTQCVDLAKSNGHTTFKDCHRSKAIVHTYLAMQDEPGRPLGMSITAHVLNSNSPTAALFVNWLRRLFGD